VRVPSAYRKRKMGNKGTGFVPYHSIIISWANNGARKSRGEKREPMDDKPKPHEQTSTIEKDQVDKETFRLRHSGGKGGGLNLNFFYKDFTCTKKENGPFEKNESAWGGWDEVFTGGGR